MGTKNPPDNMVETHQTRILPTTSGYLVSSYVDISHSYVFSDDAFAPSQPGLAGFYKPWKRCLAIVDHSVAEIFGSKILAYFTAHAIQATIHPINITEDRKDVDMLFDLCASFVEFDLIRREPVLVIGGGLVTDVVGFACAIYRRGTKYIRVPTTLIGLVDASVSNRVAVNWKGLKNRLGAYHEPLHTVIDFTFLRTLPEDELRNGMAEIIKISSCTHLPTFKAIVDHGTELIRTKFGQLDLSSNDIIEVGRTVLRQAILSVLEVEIPNSREGNLDRVMFFGHTWSPMLELAAQPPLLHGHAISIDMCYSATLSYFLGHISRTVWYEYLDTFSTLGLALDHPAFSASLLTKASQSTIETRNGKLRAPVPTDKMGTHTILGEVPLETLMEAWDMHKKVCKGFPRAGIGLATGIDIRVASGLYSGKSGGASACASI